MVIGSGPIVIGQAAEFDYAGTQACASLREGSKLWLRNDMWPFKTNSWTNPLPSYAQDPEKRAFLETVLRKISAIPNADWKGSNNGKPYEFWAEDSDYGYRCEYDFLSSYNSGRRGSKNMLLKK